MKKIISLICLITITYSCESNAPIKAEILINLSKKEAIAKYGNPLKESNFNSDEAYGEFRGPIHWEYQKKERAYIEELTWKKSTDTLVTVWYEKKENRSIPIDTLTWNKYAEF